MTQISGGKLCIKGNRCPWLFNKKQKGTEKNDSINYDLSLGQVKQV